MIKFKELPATKEIMKSPYELEEIRERLSGGFQDNVFMTSGNDLMRLLLCLANEISELKEKVSELQSNN